MLVKFTVFPEHGPHNTDSFGVRMVPCRREMGLSEGHHRAVGLITLIPSSVLVGAIANCTNPMGMMIITAASHRNPPWRGRCRNSPRSNRARSGRASRRPSNRCGAELVPCPMGWNTLFRRRAGDKRSTVRFRFALLRYYASREGMIILGVHPYPPPARKYSVHRR